MRADPRDYRALQLRAHPLLEGVPLHDVWRLRLRGNRDGATAATALSDFARLEGEGSSRVVAALFAVRSALGRLFRWDDEPAAEPGADSYLSRLTAEDRGRSLREPGSMIGPFRILYAFEREAVGEVINRTVHAFVAFALEPVDSGHTAYLAVYVKPVSRWTGAYMALIDPFRRAIVYPSLIRRCERAWAAGVTGP